MILIDQLKQIYIDGELETDRTAGLVPKVPRKDYAVGAQPDRAAASTTRTAVLRELRLRLGAQLHRLLQPGDRQAVRRSSRRDRHGEEREKLVWEIDRKLQEDGARPVIYHGRGATCWQPHVKGVNTHGQQHLQRLALRRRLAGPLRRAGDPRR